MTLHNLTYVPVDANDNTIVLNLYALLAERPKYACISHKKMPTFEDHLKFVQSEPYSEWFSIYHGENWVGSFYVTKDNEIGIGVLNKFSGKGIAFDILKRYISHHPKVRFLANINPKNSRSKHLFQKLGFTHIQETYGVKI